ncbi:MAG: hypothetical protein LBC70_04095 [Chitinispirillales bacterium]|jgi:hypothetical protein|nr:hypothetical protein [Chitinispirillales bacterium]
MNKKYIPDCKLEWYLLGALPEYEQAEIAALEQSDEELRGRIEALRESDAEILAEEPPSRLAERLAQRYSGARGGTVRWPQKRSRATRWPLSIFIGAALLLTLPILIIVVPEFLDVVETDDPHVEIEAVIDTIKIDNASTESDTF